MQGGAVFAVLVTCLVARTHGMAMTAENMTDADAMSYFMQYGYMGESVPDPAIAALMDSDPDMAFQMGIMMFQAQYEDFGLNATGVLDDATKELMAMDRCGFTDMMMMEDMPAMDGMDRLARRKRYAVVGNRWPRNDLTYTILEYTSDLSRSDTDSEIARAFEVWAAVTPLTFEKIDSTNADILITFVRRSHGDGEPFDGINGVLAHAYFPFNGNPIEGDAHFDEDENWSRATFSGTNLFQVAAHEFGHSLGLGHSNIDAALMAPFYRGYVPDFELHRDDIAGIQVLYGTPDYEMGGDDGMGGPASTDSPRTFPPNMPDFCRNSQIDAITAHIEGNVLTNYVFQGDYYVRLDNAGIEDGYPRRISDDWSGITGGIDAALYLPAWRDLPAHTLLFKGNRFYVYAANMHLVSQKSLNSAGLPSDMTGVDAAFIWGRNGKIYVMKGSQYYRLKRRNNANRLLRRNGSNYPRDIAVWDLPVDSIDAAHMWIGNSKTYFYKGQNYYRYNDASETIDIADPAYPRNTGQWWFGCNNLGGLEDGNDGSGSNALTVSNATIMSTAFMLVLTLVF